MNNYLASQQNLSTSDFAYECVVNYATFDSRIKQYIIKLSDIPDSVIYKFALIIMQQDPSRASEANGPDNHDFETKMLPALFRHLSDTANKDDQIELTNVWREGVTNYHKPYIKDLLDEAIYEYNYAEGLLRSTEDTGPARWAGEERTPCY